MTATTVAEIERGVAAIAQAADMTVATRNTKHFEPLGVRCLNPWEPHTPDASSTTVR
ncbi:hypothetical protein [Phytoactinopolyspora halophila]|uniref:hypothetical protein n=1 Tax=Phytoactinopolyspora halophila TaxID=1981511 RepID=UPI001B8C4745|nr:hypothetical protein [Phytoactinopolyspora halophila]